MNISQKLAEIKALCDSLETDIYRMFLSESATGITEAYTNASTDLYNAYKECMDRVIEDNELPFQ